MDHDPQPDASHTDADGDSALPLRIAMYLPTSAGVADASAALPAVERFLCETFGGATSYPAAGLFKRSSGSIERETVQVVEAYCEAAAWEKAKPLIWAWAAKLATLLGQESIACSVQGRLHFIGPDPSGSAVTEIRDDLVRDLAELGATRSAIRFADGGSGGNGTPIAGEGA
jgi:hypothetical protein